MPDYATEDKSKYEIWWTFGWPYETSAAMARLVFSGFLDRLPELKVLAHHMGAMVPFFEGRVGPGWDQLGKRTSDEDLTLVLKRLKKRPLDYFKDFYADTAVFGSRAATVCGLEFYGSDRVLFASTLRSIPKRAPAISATPWPFSRASTCRRKTWKRSASAMRRRCSASRPDRSECTKKKGARITGRLFCQALMATTFCSGNTTRTLSPRLRPTEG